jgi:hypothetical protein
MITLNLVKSFSGFQNNGDYPPNYCQQLAALDAKKCGLFFKFWWFSENNLLKS